MRTAKFLLMAALSTGLLTSCYTTSYYVGDVTKESPMVKVQTVKNHSVILGLVPVANNDLKNETYVSNRKNYKVEHSISVVDVILRWITFGIYTPSTTNYYLPVNIDDVKTK